MFIKTLSVSEISSYIKKVIDSDFILKNASVKGEISNIKFHSSGHIYFSLKDDNSKINCVMFKDSAMYLKFMPEDGMKVIVKGRISVYSKDGRYEIYANDIAPVGIGELYADFEKLKTKLKSEGLFDEKYKKLIPIYPRKVGVITSETGAAVRDILNVAKRRNNSIDILIYPSLVQGINAPSEIIRGIDFFNLKNNVDVIIIARGGGSLEELWAFNNEALARKIFKSKIPIVTGVGHETDFTIADFVSDRRAPTPSAACEIVLPKKDDISDDVLYYKKQIDILMSQKMSQCKNEIDMAYNSVELHNPTVFLKNQFEKVKNVNEKLDMAINYKLESEKEKLSKIYSALNSYNPLNVLKKGYSIVRDENGSVISDIEDAGKKDTVFITMKNGTRKFHISEDVNG